MYSYDASISLRCVQKLKKCIFVLGEAVSVFPPVSDSPAIQPVPRYPALPAVRAVPSHSPVPTDTDQQPLWNNSGFCDGWLQRKYSEEGNSSDVWTGKNPLFNVLLFTARFSTWSVKLYRHKITDSWSQKSSLVQNHSMLFTHHTPTVTINSKVHLLLVTLNALTAWFRTVRDFVTCC